MTRIDNPALVTPPAFVAFDLFGADYNDYKGRDLENWTQAVVGTGTVTYNNLGYLVCDTGANAGSTAMASWLPIIGTSAPAWRINWDHELVILWEQMFNDVGGAGGNKIANQRLSVTPTTGILANEGVGFGYERNGVHLICESHDGAAREFTDLGISSYLEALQGNNGGVFLIWHRPGGAAEVRFYQLNHSGVWVLLATHTTRVPAGTTGGAISMAVNNQATATQQQAWLTKVKMGRPYPVP
jgi:hypothetical protein